MIRWVFRPLTQLWASICTLERPSDLHLIFTRLHPRRVKIIIFRVVSELISLRSFKKIRTGTICQGSSPLLSYLLSLRIIGFSTKILSTLMHSLIRVSRRDKMSHFERLLLTVDFGLPSISAHNSTPLRFIVNKIHHTPTEQNTRQKM